MIRILMFLIHIIELGGIEIHFILQVFLFIDGNQQIVGVL